MASPSALERLVSASLARAGFSKQGMALVVAASGGPDSTALLSCLSRLREEHRLILHVAHLNHDFRGAEADHDAAFVQRLADGLGLPCSVDKQDPIAYQKERGVSSFEQAAREMRYAFLSSVAASSGAKAIALGHTADDQAETVLLHLLRGSGLHGLRGMSEVADWPWPEPKPGPLLFRPLLGAGKADTAAYCSDAGQTYRQDSGNYMWRFTRNKVRLDLMPRLARDYNPRVRDALLRLSRAAVEEVDFVEGEVDLRWPEISDEWHGSVRLNVPRLTALHPALQGHALRRAYATVTGDARGLSESNLDDLLSLLRRERGNRTIDLPRNAIASREYDVVTVRRRTEPPQSPGIQGEHSIRLPRTMGEEMEIIQGNWKLRMKFLGPAEPNPLAGSNALTCTSRLRLDALGAEVVVRTRRPGDRFQPSGMTGTKKLQDFYTDAKIPRDQRDRIPLLLCDRGIAWVVGHRVAEWAKAVGGSNQLEVEVSLME